MILSGRQVRAEEAFRIGLADEVVAPDALMERALERAAELARGAVLAQGLAKRAIDAGLDRPLAEGLTIEQDQFVEVFTTHDAHVGVASFLEKGAGHATFEGR
jgi:enoyl-CoA hydratase